MPLISVIVPVYNVKDYLAECIESILLQTLKDFELILIDDGSTDNSGEICDEYEKREHRIKVLHKKNGGLSSARNAGIDIAKGKYICFIDSDDYVKNTYLEYLYELVKSQKCQIAVCSIIRFDVVHGTFSSINDDNKVYLSTEAAFRYMFLHEKYYGVFAWNKLYKKELFNDIRYPEGKYYEDSGTTYKLFDLCTNIAFGGTPQYFYRVGRKGQITDTKNYAKFLDKIFFLDEMDKYFENNNSGARDAFEVYYINSLLTMYEKYLCAKTEDYNFANNVKKMIYKKKSILRTNKRLPKRVKIKFRCFLMGRFPYKAYCQMKNILR